MQRIPIFPLNLVVFPGSSYPLHIFEERYKKMLYNCLERKKGFGIVINTTNNIAKVGTYVEITSVLHKYEDGKSDIIVKGIQRFIIITTDVHKDGYIVADTHPYYDTFFEVDQLIIKETYDKFVEVIKKIKINLDNSFWRNLKSAPIKSFKFAEKSGLSLEQQQELLVLQDETKRLSFIKTHLENIMKYYSDSINAKDILMRDGYIN